MKTIENAREAKKELESKISKLLDSYHQEYGCAVENIDITRNKGIGVKTLYNVSLDVKL